MRRRYRFALISHVIIGVLYQAFAFHTCGQLGHGEHVDAFGMERVLRCGELLQGVLFDRDGIVAGRSDG